MRRAITNTAGRALVGLLVVLAALALCAGCNPQDDTDPPRGTSGLNLLTDHATGCQYLGRNNALTPRIAADGRTHMGCKEPAR